MPDRKVFCVIFAVLVINQSCNIIFFAKDFITDFLEVIYLRIINGDKNHPIIPQQVRRQPQAGVHHVQPVGVEPAHGLRVGLGGLGGDFPVPGQGVGEIVGVDEIVPRVVGRVDVDHLHLAVVGGLEQLQNLQIVPLYVEVPGVLPVHALPGAGPQRPGGPLLCQPQALRLALPLEAVLFKIVVDVLPAQPQQLVNAQLALGKALREHPAELVQVGALQVHAQTVHGIHFKFLL